MITFILVCSIIRYVKSDDCNKCMDLTKSFSIQLRNTEKYHFGGGNTLWEEKKLKPYLDSQVRFHEILENLYKEEKLALFLETHEEKVEEWWDNYKNNLTIFDFLCVENLNACCPSGKWGPVCEQCLFQPNSVISCSGNGFCQGDGTRHGDGTCKCDVHAFGTLCDKCEKGFFLQEINSTHSKCLKCDSSCLNTCSDITSSTCDSCAIGFIYDINLNKCIDLDECLGKNVCLSENEICENTYGSYHCKECDVKCKGCIGSANNCTECSPGYRNFDQDTKQAVECLDIDECSEGTHNCNESYETCQNTPGSHRCEKITQEQQDTQLLNESKDEL